MGTIYKVNEAVYTSSILEDIDLSTPDIIQAKITTPQASDAYTRPNGASRNNPLKKESDQNPIA